MESLPAMHPGIRDRMPGKVKYTLPIDFRLECESLIKAPGSLMSSIVIHREIANNIFLYIPLRICFGTNSIGIISRLLQNDFKHVGIILKINLL
jgi:hypothetical protein